MRIQDVERETGLDRATIRFYEKEDLVVPSRFENGYRTYGDEDVKLLLKIKLLRQLGVSLFKIKCLQKGSVEFSQVIDEHIKSLEERIMQDTRAIHVCTQMQEDGALYGSLDTERYFRLLQMPILNGSAGYTEPIRKESHPWRRHIARMLDYGVIKAFLLLFLITLVRIRPFGSLLIAMAEFATYFLAVPIFALMLHFWGTTPGKWVMGIRIENINGGKLSFYDAFTREKDIIWSGFGFFIPILCQWRMYESYREEEAGEENDWNRSSEVLYTDWTGRNKSGIAVIIIGVLAMNLFTATDAMLPKYKGNNITLKKFAANHFAYEKLFEARSELILGEDGSWVEDPESNVGYITLDVDNEKRPDFQFELDGKFVRAVRFTDSWVSQGFYNSIPEYCQAAMYSMVGSRPRATYADLKEMEDKIAAVFNVQLEQAAVEGSCTGSFTVNDVKISWYVMMDGCDWVYEGHLFAKDDETMRYSLDLNIEILE